MLVYQRVKNLELRLKPEPRRTARKAARRLGKLTFREGLVYTGPKFTNQHGIVEYVLAPVSRTVHIRMPREGEAPPVEWVYNLDDIEVIRVCY